MKTSKGWTNNLKNNIITEEMLSECLFSVNKRAKNCRDNKKLYRGYDFYHNYENYEAKEKEYYSIKETLLSYIQPICIHKEQLGYERQRVTSLENNFDNRLIKSLFYGEICHSNCYLDYMTDIEVSFFDKLDFKKPKYNYYLYYIVGSRTFHSPINEEDLSKYNLDIIEINHLQTHGNDINDLCSIQFIKKVLDALKNGATLEYSYHDIDDISYPFNNEYLDELKSNNIDFAISYWGPYITMLLNSYSKKHLKDYTTNNDSYLEIESKVRNELDLKISNMINKKYKQLEVIKTNANIYSKKKLKRKINGLRDFSIPNNIEVYNTEILYKIVEIFDCDYEYAPFYDITNLKELFNFINENFMEDIIKNIIKINMINEINTNIKNNPKIKQFKNELNEIEKQLMIMKDNIMSQ